VHDAAVIHAPLLQAARRWLLVAALLGTAALVAPRLAPAAESSSNPDTVPVWQQMRAQLFGSRPIEQDHSVVTLVAPSRAQDASVVPIAIKTGLGEGQTRRIARLYLFIDANPSPLGAVFTFGPRSARADIETRVRIEDYTWMRAIAELTDGRLYADQRFVKAAGGCSAPYATAPDFDAFHPRARLKVDASVEPKTGVLAELMIQHPNSSGLARDQITHLFIPPYFVRDIEVTYAGELVISAQVDFTISQNPNFRFYFSPDGGGELRARVIDTKERETSSTVQIGM
jgi:sulfur-oxidizing protein SoxY